MVAATWLIILVTIGYPTRAQICDQRALVNLDNNRYYCHEPLNRCYAFNACLRVKPASHYFSVPMACKHYCERGKAIAKVIDATCAGSTQPFMVKGENYSLPIRGRSCMDSFCGDTAICTQGTQEAICCQNK